MSATYLPFKLSLGLCLASIMLQGCETDRGKKSSQIPVTTVINQTSAPAGDPIAVSTQVPSKISPNVQELAKLLQSGVSEQVLANYILNSPLEYEVTAEEIVYLTDLGASDEIINLLIDPNARAFQSRVKEIPPSQPQANQAPEPQASVETPRLTPDIAPQESSQNAQIAVPTEPPPSSETTQYVVVEEAFPNQQSAPGQTSVIVEEGPNRVVERHYISEPARVEVHHYFYDSLNPYGTWVNVDNYGWCWSPTVAVVDVNWRPYYDRGRWLYTNQGWYWNSYYSWGHIPFHYGRWHRHAGFGWVWVPGNTWGPAWVHWRSHDLYAGWAPLPPAAGFSVGVGFTWYSDRVGTSFGFGLGYSDYAWVDYSHFHHPRLWHYHAPRNQQQAIYNNSTVNNNYIVGDNNVIINNGVDVTKVEQSSREEIRKIQIRDMKPTESRLVRAEQLDTGNNTMEVYRPTIESPKENTRITGGGGGRVESRKPEVVRSSTSTRTPQSARMTSSLAPITRSAVRPSTSRSIEPAQRPQASAAKPAEETSLRPSPSSLPRQTPSRAAVLPSNTANPSPTPSRPENRPGANVARSVSTQSAPATVNRSESRKTPTDSSTRLSSRGTSPSTVSRPSVESGSSSRSAIRTMPTRTLPTVTRSPYANAQPIRQTPTIVRSRTTTMPSSTRISPSTPPTRSGALEPSASTRIGTENRSTLTQPSPSVVAPGSSSRTPTIVRSRSIPTNPTNPTSPRIAPRSSSPTTRVAPSTRISSPSSVRIQPQSSAPRSSSIRPPSAPAQTRSIQPTPAPPRNRVNSSSSRIAPNSSRQPTGNIGRSTPPAPRASSPAPSSSRTGSSRATPQR